MQTFLPYESFEASARVLDYRRLGKQRVETLQLLNALTGVTKGWGSHPAATMWRGYEKGLAVYGLVMVEEWLSRGYRDTCAGKIMKAVDFTWQDFDAPLPIWLGWPDFHIAHQSNLVRKNPDFYGHRFPFVPPDLDYVWPGSIEWLDQGGW